jgi:hypothetical protein
MTKPLFKSKKKKYKKDDFFEMPFSEISSWSLSKDFLKPKEQIVREVKEWT